MPPAELALSVGRRLRELRQGKGMGQAELARRLGISAAYMSLIEKGHRNLPLELMWRALEALDVEPEPFLQSLGERRAEQSLGELLDEPLWRSLELDRDDLLMLSAEPRAVTTIAALFNLYKNTRTQLDHLLSVVARGEADRKARSTEPDADAGLRLELSPYDEVADFVQREHNYFPEIEEQSHALRTDERLPRRVSADALVQVLERRGIRVEQSQGVGAGSVVRRFDPEAGVLTLSDALPEARRKFELAHVIGLAILPAREGATGTALTLGARHHETPRLVTVHLANYFAGALLMPYDDFFVAARTLRYDVDRLAEAFDVSYEAAAHRLTNLADPKRRGVPLHFLRVDVAGNISKRYSATGLAFPVALGSCPKWVAHTAFLAPSVVNKQYSVMPDGTTYLCFAKVTSQPLRGSLVKGTVYSIGLGARVEDAAAFAYADDLPRYTPERRERVAVPVGVTCRFCERTDCNQRAAPSYKFAFSPDPYVKKDNFFSPLLDADVGRPRGRDR